MAENFVRQAISEVKAELNVVRRKRGKNPPAPLNPVATLLKKRGFKLGGLR